MLCCEIAEGALYYGETRHRHKVKFTDELRGTVREMLRQMHELRERGYTPKVKPSKACRACSLNELCLPTIAKRKSASEYIAEALRE